MEGDFKPSKNSSGDEESGLEGCVVLGLWMTAFLTLMVVALNQAIQLIRAVIG